VTVAPPPLMAVFDTETTGVDVTQARIVQAFVGLMNAAGELVEKREWLIDPGVEIPEGAAAVHGISTERARAEGVDAKGAIFEISQRLDIYDRRGIPIVIYNAPFDLTLLAHEMNRHYPGAKIVKPSIVIDPYVLDKAIDKWRKGKRKLVDVAAHYNVEVLANAHDAVADCTMTGQLAYALLRDPRLRDFPLRVIHKKTGHSKWAQMQDFRKYLQKKGEPWEDVSLEWPIQTETFTESMKELNGAS
jgi:DNA polymerase-3 subunit epsilon